MTSMSQAQPYARICLLAFVLLLSCVLASAKPVLEGPARVVDGDTLWIGTFEPLPD